LSPHLEPWRCRPLSSGRHCPRFLPYARSACLTLPFFVEGVHASVPILVYFSFATPTWRLRFRRLTTHQILYCITDQRAHITRLIAVYGPTRRVSFTSARCPDSVIVATLYECLSIGEILSLENFIILNDHSS
jgi:hypothetical protein